MKKLIALIGNGKTAIENIFSPKGSFADRTNQVLTKGH